MALTKVQSGFVDLSTSSGLSVGTGTASAPAINFGTSNTGLLGDSDEVAISVSGSRILTAKNGNLGINTSSPSHRLEIAGTTRTSYLSLPSPGSGNAAISVDSFNAGDIIRRTTATGSGTNLGLIYSSASVYLAYHMYANRNSATFEEYPLKSSSSSTVKRAGLIVGNHGIALGTGSNYAASVDEALPHTHFTYNLIDNDGDLILNQHTNDNTGNRGIFFRVGASQVMPLSNLSKALINFKRTTTYGRGQLDFHVDAGADDVSCTVSDTTSLSLSYDQNTVGLPTEFGPAEKYGDVDQGNKLGPAVQAAQLAKGRHYIQLQSNYANNQNNANDPAWIAWKGSTSRGETSGGAATTVPFGGYCARIGGYRDKVDDGSTSIGWETVENVAILPHTMTRQMTMRYNGRIAMGNNIEPDCHLDMGSVDTAIRVPNGTTAERPSTGGSAGQLRFNTDSVQLEYSNGTAWYPLSAGQIETTSGDVSSTANGKKTVEFRSSGTFNNTGSAQVAEIFVIGGGGGGGGGGKNAGSCGGGGGGMVYGTVEIPTGSFSVTVGGGGAGATANSSNDGSSPAASGGVTSSVTINGVTFQATGGGGAPAMSASNDGGSGFNTVTGPNGGTGTINGGTSYSGPALRDGTNVTPVYGTGGKGGDAGGVDSGGQGTFGTGGGNGTNGGAGGGGCGENMPGPAGNITVGPPPPGGNGNATYFTGGGGGGGADCDGGSCVLASGGTGLHSGGAGGDADSSASNGAGPSGGSRGSDGSQRKNAGGGGGSFGGGGGGAGDASNSHGGQGGSGGGGLVVIRFLV